MPVLIVLIIAITIVLVSYIHHRYELIRETRKSSEYLNLKQLKDSVEVLTATIDDARNRIPDFGREDLLAYMDYLKSVSNKYKEINDNIEIN